MRFNKVCEREDFAEPDLVRAMRTVFPHRAGREERGDWEAGMAVRALARFGAVRPDATILAVPDAAGDVLAHLAGRVGQVLPAPGGPGGPAPVPLPYPNASFDAVVWRRLDGGVRPVAAMAYEVGRVLKPAGVGVVIADFRLAGPPGGTGGTGRPVFDAAELERFVVMASGLERVDDLHAEVSDATRTSRRDIGFSTTGPDAFVGDGRPRREPHLVLVRDGYVFTSVCLVLRKTEAYRAGAGAWARPA